MQGVRYIAHTTEGEAQLMPDGLNVLQLRGHQQADFHLHFLGAKPTEVCEESAAGGFVNYYLGKTRTAWIQHVPLFLKVRYRQVYPGIDLVFHGNGNRLEYDFVLGPGADSERVEIGLGSSETMQLQGDGSLLVTSGGDSLRLLAPKAWQKVGATTQPVKVGYRLLATNKVGFTVGPYDRSSELVIDPVVAYATMLTTNNSTQVSAAATDSSGDLIITGSTFSSNYPVVNGQAGSSSSEQVFVTKFDPSGQNILYSTYMPASGFNTASGVAVDGSGNAYIIGIAGSSDFPTTSQNLGACSSFCNAGFIAKLDPTGTLVYSTLLASGQILPKAIKVNTNGNAFVSGLAADASLQTVNAFQTAYTAGVCTACDSAFFAELNSAGTGYVFSSYLGAGLDATGLALDSSGNLYVAGPVSYPIQASVPLKGELESGIGGFFLTKFASDGKTLLFGSYLGGDVRGSSTPESLAGLAVGSEGTVYLAGSTASNGFPYTIGAFDHPPASGGYGSTDMFAMALNPSLTALTYSTYLGGGNLTSMTLDSAGNLYAAGWSGVSLLPRKNAVVSDLATGNFFLKLDKSGNPVNMSYFDGHEITQSLAAIALDPSDNVYLAGTVGTENTALSLVPCSLPDPILVGPNAYTTQSTLPTECGQAIFSVFFAKVSPASAPQISLGYFLPNLVLHNVGSADLHISSITFSGGITKALGNCGTTVPAGTSCVLTLTDANNDLAQGSVTITSDASPAVQNFTPYLNPMAVGSPVPDLLWVDTSQLAFSPQQIGTPSAPHPLYIWNVGARNMPLQSVSAAGAITQTNDCGTSLAPGSYCTEKVVWTPPNAGGANELAIAYDNGNQANASVTTSLYTSPNPILVSQSSALPFGTQTVGHPSFYRTVTVTNVSDAQVASPSVSLSGDKEFTLAGNTCTGNLAVQQSCIAAAIFTPVIDGDRSATLNIGSAASIQLRATGQIASAVSVSPLQLLWSAAVLNAVAYTQDITLTNSSATSVPISGISFSLPDYSETDTCSGAVPAQGSCVVHVAFQPQDIGARNGTMTIAFGNQITSQVITITGNGIYPITLSPASISFGTNNPVGVVSASQSVFISNASPNTSLMYSLSVSGPFAIDTKNNTCSNPVPAGYACGVPITFNPVTAGPQTGTVTVSTPGITKTSSIPLSGTAYTPPMINVASSLSFGNVAAGTSDTLPLAISDSGSQDLSVSNLAVSGTNASDFAAAPGQCATVKNGSPCNVNVTFSPSAAGARSAVLTITGNSANSPQTVELTGTGTTPSIGIGSAGGTFSSTVSSGQPATYNLILAGSSGFSGVVTLGCSGVPQNASCSVFPTSLTLAPGGTQAFTVNVLTQSTTTAAIPGEDQTFLAGTGILSLITGFLFFFGNRRSWIVTGLLCIVVTMVSFTVGACGGGSSGSTLPPPGHNTANTPPGTYTLTVSAASGAVSDSQALTLVVQ